MARDSSLDIAVTGVSARFPGAADLDEWWSALLAGATLTTRIDRETLLADGVPRDLVDDPDYVPARGLLADSDRFDAAFFRVSPRDAEMMDPQHRLMLETAWTALEDAGVDPSDAGTTAVYASGSGSGYLRAMLTGGPLDPATLDQAIHGTEPDFIASLISYKLGLTGPAIAVQTACSSGLVAVHLAVQALLGGDCDQAVVVAAGIDFPQAGHLHVPGGIQSVSGQCRPFDAAADGVVAGSGVACVVLRRLADALDEGVEPYGVILGTAVNNDGSAKVGYYAPSVAGQEAVIRAAYEAADVEAESVGYLETHGTGTRVGDPIEWSAASTALADLGAAPGQVAIGALKANMGHLDAAAGLASLIKALFVVRHGRIAPVAGLTELNPLLDAEDSPLSVPTEATPWTGPLPRRAGISSFGIGGTNAHVLIEQAPAHEEVPVAAAARLVVLSAADPEALDRQTADLGTHLADHDPRLADVAATLATGRAVLPERLAVAGRTSAEIADRLAWGVRGTAAAPAPVVFLFPGQGTQRPGMAVPLAAALPGFGAALNTCLDAFEPELAERLRYALYDDEFPAAELAATELAQPALFAVEYAAAVALAELGIRPAAVAGHSLGEITAACVTGVLDLPAAARLVASRGEAMRACPDGAMLAVGCAADDALALVAESGAELELAAANAPDSSVVAGTVEAVESFAAWLGERVFARRLRTSRAFHSVLIEPAVEKLAGVLAGVPLAAPAVPIAAGATGELVETAPRLEMFTEAARRPVLFAAALGALARRFPGALFLEVGPGRALSSLAAAQELTEIPLAPGRTDRPDEEVLTALGSLWTVGQPVALDQLCADGAPVHLPGYPFRGPRWMAPEVSRALAAPPAASEVDTVAAAAESVVAEEKDAGELLAGLWAEVLGHTELDETSDFFELGGDSLLITHLARKVNNEFGIRVPLRDMLVGRTLGRQTDMVRELVAAANA